MSRTKRNRIQCGSSDEAPASTIEERMRTAFALADSTGTPQEVLGDDGKRVMLIVCPKDVRPLPEDEIAELRAENEMLRDAIVAELAQRHVDDSYGRDKSACQTVSKILERRGMGFSLETALARSTPKDAATPEERRK